MLLHRVSPRLPLLVRYFAFNSVLTICAALILKEIVALSSGLSPVVSSAVVLESEPSRVEKFKQAEVEAALAPQVPVPRLVVAEAVPDVPVQVLAVRLDQAESIKSQPLKLKRKTGRQAKMRGKQVSLHAAKSVSPTNKIPTAVVEFANSELGYRSPLKKKNRGSAVAESSLDIINRNLGVLVALKN